MKYSLTLPFPVSTNKIWASHRGRLVISKKYRDFCLAVKEAVTSQLGSNYRPLKGNLSISMRVHMPDRRKRDIDNLIKSTLDALQKTKVFNDDNQVSEIHICRANAVVKGGRFVASITTIGNI